VNQPNAKPADGIDERREPSSAWARMKERWGVSNWGVIAILVAFSLAGMSVLKISGPIMNFLLPADTPRWLWWICRILIIVPVYEALLMGYGTLLGQRRFFVSKQKKMWGRIFGSFRRRSHA
jgi:hypothetical protein